MVARSFGIYATALPASQSLGGGFSDASNPTDAFRSIASIARLAESHGFDGSLAFHNLRDPDPWLTAAIILESTVRITPIVAANPTTMPPHTAAKHLAGLIQIHRRRIDLNLIVGASPTEAEEIGDRTPREARYGRLREYAEVLDACISTNSTTYAGEHYNYASVNVNALVADDMRPRKYLAGGSPDALSAAAATGSTLLVHPEPVEKYKERIMSMGAVPRGIRLGIVADKSDKLAWSRARSMYAANVRSRRYAVLRARANTSHLAGLAALALQQETIDDVYWLGAFLANKGSVPILVGSYQRAADYLAQYLETGITTLILGNAETERDFDDMSRTVSLTV